MAEAKKKTTKSTKSASQTKSKSATKKSNSKAKEKINLANDDVLDVKKVDEAISGDDPGNVIVSNIEGIVDDNELIIPVKKVKQTEKEELKVEKNKIKHFENVTIDIGMKEM